MRHDTEVMRWPWSKKEVHPSSTLHERVTALETDLRANRRDIDDLDERLRSLMGRVTKKRGLEMAAAADAAAADAPPTHHDPRVAALMAARRGSRLTKAGG